MPGSLGVWEKPPSSDRSGGAVATCCPRSKAGAEEVECRWGKIEGVKLEKQSNLSLFFYIAAISTSFQSSILA